MAAQGLVAGGDAENITAVLAADSVTGKVEFGTWDGPTPHCRDKFTGKPGTVPHTTSAEASLPGSHPRPVAYCENLGNY